MKIYKCRTCGQILISINEKTDNITCCGNDMMLLKAGEVDAAVEKHVPVYTLEDNILNVQVGEVIHPMEEDHFIECIIYEYNGGYDIVRLHPGEEPKAKFNYKGSGVLYEYCNKHGLWKKEI